MCDPGRPFRPMMLLLALAVFAGLLSAAEDPPAGEEAPSIDPAWLDRLDRLDRILLDQLVGYAPPAFTNDLKWLGAEPVTWQKLRGKVVLLQSWTQRTRSGRRVLADIDRLGTRFEEEDLRIILLHTPEGAETLERFLERRPVEYPVVLDATGAFCDALGVYKDPANILVGRNGAVRYVGLNEKGTVEAVKKLLAEEADPTAEPKQRNAAGETETDEVEFPEISGTISGANDVRGQKAPKLFAEKWISPPPDPTGKIVIIDFWNTDCESYLELRERTNRLADRFRNQVIFIGLSDEWSSQFDEGLLEENLDEDDFHYTLALDPRRRMQSALNLQRLPHTLVLSSDWVVRWQGPPQRLTEKTIDQIVRADGGQDGNATEMRRPKRWTEGR
ncbi:MAG: redoxin domain-containing protein [Planctomycetota bacterium]|nr:redoxin domain-containing protein [Planctomycetota bacterium]